MRRGEEVEAGDPQGIGVCVCIYAEACWPSTPMPEGQSSTTFTSTGGAKGESGSVRPLQGPEESQGPLSPELEGLHGAFL